MTQTVGTIRMDFEEIEGRVQIDVMAGNGFDELDKLVQADILLNCALLLTKLVEKIEPSRH